MTPINNAIYGKALDDPGRSTGQIGSELSLGWTADRRNIVDAGALSRVISMPALSRGLIDAGDYGVCVTDRRNGFDGLAVLVQQGGCAVCGTNPQIYRR